MFNFCKKEVLGVHSTFEGLSNMLYSFFDPILQYTCGLVVPVLNM
jgi:hypothetical protein